MRPFPPIDGLELFQAHAALDLGIFRNLLIGLESVRPVGIAERGNGAHDRLPLGDGQARIGEPRRAADQDHGDDESRDRGKPDAQRPELPRPRRDALLPRGGAVGQGRGHSRSDSGPPPKTQSPAPCPIAAACLVLARMRAPCRDACTRPECEGGWRAEKRKILMARASTVTRAPSRRANHGVFRHRALLSSGPSRIECADRSVSQLLAGTPSGPGGSSNAARVPCCDEARRRRTPSRLTDAS